MEGNGGVSKTSAPVVMSSHGPGMDKGFEGGGSVIEQGVVVEMSREDTQIPEVAFDNDKFANRVFDEALENGEDSAFEMLANDEFEDGEEVINDDENGQVEIANIEESAGSQIATEVEEQTFSKVESLNAEINILKAENQNLKNRVENIENKMAKTQEAGEILLEMIKKMIEEEKKKDEKSMLEVLMMLMAKLLEVIIVDTPRESRNGTVEKQAA